MRGSALALAAAVLAGGAAPAPPDHLWAKPGATDAAVASDAYACAMSARQAAMQTPVRAGYAGVVGGGFAAGAAGGAAGYLLAYAISQHQAKIAEKDYAYHCMRRRGYAWLPLTAAEQEALAQRKVAAEKSAWIDAFYAADLSARIDAAGRPVVPPLPEGRVEPLVFDGLRFDPANLAPAKGIVPDEGVVLSGTAELAHTALLKAGYVLPGRGGESVDAGAIFYQVVSPGPYEHDQTYWCGPFRYHTALRSGMEIACVSASDEGYELWPAAGGPPLAGLPLLIAPPAKAPGLDFTLEANEAAAIGPLKFTIKATWLNFYNVDLEADVIENGRHVPIFRAITSYGPDGTAVLPFWTHRLVLRRIVGSGVTAKLTPDGDGKGWLDARPPAM